MKTFKIIGIIILIFILGFFIGAFFLKDSVNVEKKIVINAPIEKIFESVNNFHNWDKWSLWSDTTMATTYEGAAFGKGAKMIWHDKKEGVGEMEIIESKFNEMIITQLSFKNTESKTKSEFHFKQLAEGVEVSWSLKSENYSYPFGRYAAWLIAKGLNKSFTTGLEKLKAFAESDEKLESGSTDYVVEVLAIEEKMYAAIKDSGNSQEISNKMGVLYGNLSTFLANNKQECIGYPISIWHYFDPQNTSVFSCALPVGKEFKPEKNVQMIKFPATKVAMVKYTGPYDGSYNAWMTLEDYIKKNKLEINGNPWEEYVTDPATEPDSTKWITNIYYPIK